VDDKLLLFYALVKMQKPQNVFRAGDRPGGDCALDSAGYERERVRTYLDR
jgi:hypothetical protein